MRVRYPSCHVFKLITIRRSLGADDARPAKRTRLGETASLDNPEECNGQGLSHLCFRTWLK